MPIRYSTPNRKQRGSNIGGMDYFNGMCPNHCEACFVNFGRNSLFFSRMSPRRKEAAKKAGWKGEPYLIPKMDDIAWGCFVREVECPDGKLYPLFMRSGCLHDSADPPLSWTKMVGETWGDYLFFNCSILSIAPKRKFDGRAVRHNLDAFHKLVVTVNGGRQMPMLPLVGTTPEMQQARHIEKVMQTRESLGDRAPGDFFSPLSLEDVGLGKLEGQLKWYRRRVLSTVVPRFETSVPVVDTVMRFRGAFQAIVWAMKYGMSYEVESGSKSVVNDILLLGGEVTKRPGRTVVRIWIKDDDNVSPYAGEPTILTMVGTELKCDPRPLESEPWVCDRSGYGCQACGLCASLDGTYPGAVNPLNPVPPVPFSMGYIMDVPDYKMHENPAQLWGDAVFAQRLSELMWENPTPRLEEKEFAWVNQSLQVIGNYSTADGHWDDGWNTWSNADTLLAYCFWVLMRIYWREHGDARRAYDEAIHACDELSGVPNLCAGLDDLVLLIDDDGSWYESFGSIYADDEGGD